MTQLVTKDSCRACGAAMSDVLSLGDIVPVDFIKDGDVVRDPAPLTLAECEACHLVQLRHTLHRDSLYRQYWYLSGLNPTMVTALQDVVTGIEKRITLLPEDVVIDIGANDGTLLSMYSTKVHKIGFDPALNLAEGALAVCDQFINDYFETDDLPLPAAKVITSIAMFYDLDEPHLFLRRVVDVLRQDGIWVMQMTDLVRMLRANAFDNICHEHLCYYPLGVFRALIDHYGLEIFDVEFNDVNGASVRTYVGWKGAYPIQPCVDEALADEEVYLADNAIRKFSDRVEDARARIVDFVRAQRAAGKRFHALGASTKGNTLLQYYGFTDEEIEAAAEVNPAKYGLRMAASNVPIVSQAESLAAHPDYYLVLPWHFIDFFVRKQADYIAAGGVLVAPLPNPRTYGHEARDL